MTKTQLSNRLGNKIAEVIDSDAKFKSLGGVSVPTKEGSVRIQFQTVTDRKPMLGYLFGCSFRNDKIVDFQMMTGDIPKGKNGYVWSTLFHTFSIYLGREFADIRYCDPSEVAVDQLAQDIGSAVEPILGRLAEYTTFDFLRRWEREPASFRREFAVLNENWLRIAVLSADGRSAEGKKLLVDRINDGTYTHEYLESGCAPNIVALCKYFNLWPLPLSRPPSK